MGNPDINPSPGWRYAAGDPKDTLRYWDGASWWGDPQQSFMGQESAVEIPGDSAGLYKTAPLALAGLSRRGFAAVLDGMLAVVVALAVRGQWFPTELSVQQLKTSVVVLDGSGLALVLFWLAVALVLPCLAYTLTVWRYGWTPGKRLAGLAVVGKGGWHTPSLGSAARRAAVKTVVFPVGLVLVFGGVWMLSAEMRSAQILSALAVLAVICVPLASRRRRGVWDLVAGTEVVVAPLR